MVKKRSFAFTFHNVKSYESKKVLEDYVKPRSKRYLCGCEEYPEHPGEYHIHLYVTFRNPRSFHATIDEYQDFARDFLVGPQPEGRIGDWGRVEVDKKRGTFEASKQYIQGLTKDKPIDPNITDYRAPPDHHIRCDVCQMIVNRLDAKYVYPEPGAGRCYLCGGFRHSVLTNYGHAVRNCDDACVFNKARWDREKLGWKALIERLYTEKKC